MIKKGISVKKISGKKKGVFGILIGGSSYVSSDFVKFVRLGVCLVSVHDMSERDHHSSERILSSKVVQSSGFCRGFSAVKKVWFCD